MTSDFQLTRNSFEHLVLISSDGTVHENVSPVRAFPIQSPDEGISLVLEDGQEVAWIDRLSDLPEAIRALVDAELAGREFMPVIQKIESISSYATPCTWHVKTDRGSTAFILKGDEDIRRLGLASILISDNHGIQFLIRDMHAIDRHSRKILDRFL
ncbi:cyanophycin metabolism-associated DUF1854 family protein [Undibacterium parvum]|uniref:DUF1854 domain-containing protein n=1 Tax=Undibacterium parvum TaxID=401471 RepID=A0A3Q9BMX2_9BURK|nr:DUF1854 domain-containing protein [Undibacterium parvum]AZP10666.1 DUF1854 domain-containing protein [Undibacterium parvum]